MNLTPREKLIAAIAAYSRTGDTGPGRWEVRADDEGTEDEQVRLVYEVAIVADEDNPHQPHPLIKQGDEPYLDWGGNSIIAAAGLECTDGHIDTYTDRSGMKWYTDAATLRTPADPLDSALRRLGDATARRPHGELVEILSQALAITRTGGAGSRRQAADLIEAAIKRITDRGAK